MPKKKRKELRIEEVSFARFPANEETFLIKKEIGGNIVMNKFLLWAIAHAEDIPEVAKEEVKSAVGEFPEEISKEDVLNGLKELGVELTEVKKEEPEDKFKDVPEEFRKEFEDLKAQTAQIKKEKFEAELKAIVKEEQVEKFVKLYGKVEDAEIIDLAKEFAKIEKAMEEFGKGQGTSGSKDDMTGKSLDAVIEEFMKKEKIEDYDEALDRLYKEKPELFN